MTEKQPGQSWRIVRWVVPSLGLLGGCWLAAFSGGNGGQTTLLAVGVVLLVAAGIVAFVWLVSKVAHGGDWAHRRARRRRQRLDAAAIGTSELWR